MSNTFTAVKKHYKQYGREEREDGVVDVDVTFDGTWMTRGHRSHIGIAFVLEADTRQVLDFEVLCNHCIPCSKERTSHRDTFQEWFQTHKSRCHKNFEGKAGEMEAEAARRLWQRSETLGFRYITFVGDGDSSAYKAVCALNDGTGPYSCRVVKEECINHVGKRLGTRLRKLKKETAVMTTTKTGKARRLSVLGGAKKLTDHVIDKLSFYYNSAIRRTARTTVEEMKQAIWQSFFHLSAKEDQHHALCPRGAQSWCFVKRAEAEGKQPESHSTKSLYLASLPHEQLELVKGVYRDLASPTLLQKCLSGRTQNPNESLHSKVWRKASKDKNAGLHRIRFVTQVTIWEHNFGYQSYNLLQKLGLEISRTTRVVQEALDKQRKRHQTPRGKKRAPAPQDNEEKSLPGRKRRKVEETPAYQAGAH
ncbi:uncharacterized protein LOC126994185 [Eriocheir sinensis]|uniref:uncharacterized protein LOC126994185 n=1 Tax=Eriocheir sinensis TaxID=95602 RepID=UPI0021CA2E1D|nr:uncharacterized protein LOC126994185 [Eriocheir sinensis]